MNPLILLQHNSTKVRAGSLWSCGTTGRYFWNGFHHSRSSTPTIQISRPIIIFCFSRADVHNPFEPPIMCSAAQTQQTRASYLLLVPQLSLTSSPVSSPLRECSRQTHAPPLPASASIKRFDFIYFFYRSRIELKLFAGAEGPHTPTVTWGRRGGGCSWRQPDASVKLGSMNYSGEIMLTQTSIFSPYLAFNFNLTVTKVIQMTF